MKKIYALTDYKNHFGSKWKASPYRSGYDKSLLKKYFNKYDFEIEFVQYKNITFNDDIWKNKVVIYTSSEEIGLNYKSYIEDIVLGIENSGAHVIPGYSFFRANNNKVCMEILRDQLLGDELSGNRSKIYGTFEELKEDLSQNKINYPCVIKKAAGAMSRGVFIANSEKALEKYAKKISRIPNYFAELKEILRKLKHKDYKAESKYQNKFIIQPFIPNLRNDWKVLVYGDHYYILNRGIKENDFRASGSHYNYKAGSKSEFPIHMLDMVEKIFKKLDVPHLSLDFAYDGEKSYVHEIQAVHFGTSTICFSDDYYTKRNGNWIVEKKQFDQEEEYVWGLVKYFEDHQELF